KDLAARLGEWPLLLRLTNKVLLDRVRQNRQTLPAALSYINQALDKRGLTAFDARDGKARTQAVATTLGVSLERLSQDERTRFSELAIFPDDTNIPIETVAKLWAKTGGMDQMDAEELCTRLNN